jgi:lysophospholipase L1-like esterase
VKLLTKLALILGGLLFMFLLGETATRLYFFHAYDVSPVDFHSLPPRHPLGWQGKQSIGNLTSTRPRILVVGDSMTHGVGFAEENELYYHVLEQGLGVDVFAYGAPGFGTLQEAMVIDQYVPMVKPDLVVLQVCFNDLINNSWEIESRSYLNNNFSVRPYWENGRVRYRFPSRLGNYTVITGHSRLAHWLAQQVAQVTAEFARRGVLHRIEDDMARPDFPPLQRAFATTETIITNLKARLDPHARLVAFAGDGPELYWRPVFERHGIPFFDGVPRVIAAEEQRLGTSIRPDGAHWDARGHRVVGEALARWLQQQHLIAR